MWKRILAGLYTLAAADAAIAANCAPVQSNLADRVTILFCTSQNWGELRFKQVDGREVPQLTVAYIVHFERGRPATMRNQVQLAGTKTVTHACTVCSNNGIKGIVLTASVQGAPASRPPGQGNPLFAQLQRKANAREQENGFCSRVNWPVGTSDGYVQFLERAVVGSMKVNSFKGGSHCQLDVVTQVWQGAQGKCVRYAWFACAVGTECARGQDADCKDANGEWVRQ